MGVCTFIGGCSIVRRKHELIEGAHISCWDNGEKWADRYTVVFLDDVDKNGYVQYLGMGPAPFNHQGFCQHGDMPLCRVKYKGRGGVFDKRIAFADLPVDCQTAVMQTIKG